MTQSFTITETWTQTHARYLAGKMAADLLQFQQAYGHPEDERILKYEKELEILLPDKCVKEISYGFKRDGVWIVAMKFLADMNGQLTVDDRSGRIPRGANVTGAEFTSFLEYSDAWARLTPSKRNELVNQLPFQRTTGIEPLVVGNGWTKDKSYSAAGCGLHRATVGGAE